jgi:hypothetical protein
MAVFQEKDERDKLPTGRLKREGPLERLNPLFVHPLPGMVEVGEPGPMSKRARRLQNETQVRHRLQTGAPPNTPCGGLMGTCGRPALASYAQKTMVKGEVSNQVVMYLCEKHYADLAAGGFRPR